MQLSKRLKAVADLVTPGNRVADIGCDHAYTSIYLAKNDISPRIIAMDVNQGPIDRANENIIKYGYEDKIETRKSDGLEKLREYEVDTIVIAGMGGALTLQILTNHLPVMKSVKELILQPQSEIYKVRQMLQEYGFLVTKENMLKEDGKYYVMIKALKKDVVSDTTKFELMKEEHFHYGRLLLEQKLPVLKEFLLWEASICKGILDALAVEESEKTQVREAEIKEKLQLIDQGLKYFDLV